MLQQQQTIGLDMMKQETVAVETQLWQPTIRSTDQTFMTFNVKICIYKVRQFVGGFFEIRFKKFGIRTALQ